MKIAHSETPSLLDHIANTPATRFLWDRATYARVIDLTRGTSLGGKLAALVGRSVLLATESQLSTALALIELDGRTRRLTLLPPDTEIHHLNSIIANAEIDAIVIDRELPQWSALGLPVCVHCAPSITHIGQMPTFRCRTEWVLLTSGTVGVPKMVIHDVASLTAPMEAASPADGANVWATFYDIRRYGGLQIFLRSVLGGASLVLSSAGEAVADHLARLASHGITHLSGTPSHWRRALVHNEIRTIAPRYVRLSGEIADQAVLDALRANFPAATIGHTYASTEAGVAFDVNDGLTGFPASYIERIRDGVALKVVGGSLRIRSRRTAFGYLGAERALMDDDGFVDTGDIVEQRGDRCYFVGRKDGIINVGGLKVHPEEVEMVINRHPQVRMSLVRPTPNPYVGAIVTADVVLKSECELTTAQQNQVRNDILTFCRRELPRYKVPAVIKFVANLQIAATGKLARR